MLRRTPVGKLLLTLLAVFLSQSISAAQSSPPKTVLDYYLLLPEKYFEANKEQRVKWMLDLRRGAVVDIMNGYIYAAGDGAQTPIYVCLFKRPGDLIKIHKKEGMKNHSSHSKNSLQVKYAQRFF
jgi:hypothetical protein